MSINVLYTTSDSIRSAIGIDENDISDDMIAACNLDLQMAERLETILPTYEVVVDSSEAGERRVKLWCQYYGALTLLESAPLGIPQKIQANNDQVARFALDFEAIKTELRGKLAALESKLLGTDTSTLRPGIMGVSTPSYDPIVGAQ